MMCVKELVISALLWHAVLCTTTTTSTVQPTAANTSDTVITSSGSSSTQVSGKGAFKPVIISKQWGWSILGHQDKKKIETKFGGGGVSVFKDAKGMKKGVMWQYNGTGLLRTLNDSQIPDELFDEDAANIDYAVPLNVSDDSDTSDDDEDNDVGVPEQREVNNAVEEGNGRARRDIQDGAMQSSAAGGGNWHTVLSIVATLLALTKLG